MRTLFLFFLLITFDVLKAQDDFYNPYFEIKAGDELMLLYDKVNVYESPNHSAKLLDKLPLGHKVIVKSRTEVLDTFAGLKLPWLEISYLLDAREKVAFIWSGMLSFPVDYYASDKNLTFLYGISKIKTDEQKKTNSDLYINCKILSKGKLLVEEEFKAIGNSLSYYRNLNVYDNKGLNGIKNILNFDFRNVYYSGEYGSQVFFWDGKKIHAVKDIKNLADPPCYNIEEMVYPNDYGGTKDFILIKSENGCNEGEQQIESKIEKYIFKKKKLKRFLE
jgi:hypothetical protein